MLWVWSSLVVAVAALVGSIAFVVVRTLDAWRRFRALAASLGDANVALLARAETVSAKAGSLGDESARMTDALARLGRSRTRMAVLPAAIADVRAAAARATGLVPRK